MVDDDSNHAVVIGGSVGGLLTAAVLARHFDRVSVLDRDDLPDGPVPRKGTPQCHHPHLLMGAGFEFIERHFPAIVEEMVAGGAEVRGWDSFAWHYFGSWRPRIDPGLRILHSSRFFLESHLRRRVRALPNVTVRSRTRVTGLCVDGSGRRVAGVHTLEGGAEEELAATLVVDVSGAASKASDWMEAMGFERPAETRIGIKLAYTSRIYSAPPDFPTDSSFVVLYPSPPTSHRGGFLYALDNGQWMVSLNGYFGDHAPTDDAGFLAFAKTLPQPHIYERMQRLEPASDIVRYTIPANVRRRFDRLDDVPDGFVVLGDAATRFNPVFAQGMAAAALGATALDRTLQATGPKASALPRQFYRRHARALAVPWLLTSTTDLRFPQSDGVRPAWLGALNWYTGSLIRLCGDDPSVYERFLRVLHMLDGLGPVVSPVVIAKVVRHAARTALQRTTSSTPVSGLPPIQSSPGGLTPCPSPEAHSRSRGSGPSRSPSQSCG